MAMEMIQLEDQDYNEVKALKQMFLDNRNRLNKAENQIVNGWADILMFVDRKSLAKTMEDIKVITNELENLRTNVEPALMTKLKEKYGDGRLEPYTIQWIKQ